MNAEFVEFKAYLDSLHDFCSSNRNKSVPEHVMKQYIRHAFRMNLNEAGLQKKLQSFLSNSRVSSDMLSKLRRQIMQIYDYKSGMFDTFEQNVLDFVSDIYKLNTGDLNVVLELKIKKNGPGDVKLNTVIPKKVVYDTSDLSYEYVCNTMNKQIITTTATNWDADGKVSHVPTGCERDRTDVFASLTKDAKELSTLSEIFTGENLVGIVTEKGKRPRDISWGNIMSQLQNTLNVKTYAHTISTGQMRDTIRQLLDIKPGEKGATIAGKITDIKRSGDWLQLKSMVELKRKVMESVDSDYVIYTRDIPLAAHALSENETSVVTYSKGGLVAVRIIGKPEMTPEIRAMKIQELGFYKDVLAKAWPVSMTEDVDKKLSNVIRLFRSMLEHISVTWGNDNMIDLDAKVMLPRNVFQQKLIHITCFTVYMLLHFIYMKTHHATVSKKIYAQYQDISNFLTQTNVPHFDLLLLQKIMDVKKFLTSPDGLSFTSAGMISTLDIETLMQDAHYFLSCLLDIDPQLNMWKISHLITKFGQHESLFMTSTLCNILQSMKSIEYMITTGTRQASMQFSLNKYNVISEGGGTKKPSTRGVATKSKVIAKKTQKAQNAAIVKAVKSKLVGVRLEEHNYGILMANVNYDISQTHHYIKMAIMLHLDNVEIGALKKKLVRWSPTNRVIPENVLYHDPIIVPVETGPLQQNVDKLMIPMAGGRSKEHNIDAAYDVADWIMNNWYDQSVYDGSMYIPQMLYSVLLLNKGYWCNATTSFNVRKLPFYHFKKTRSYVPLDVGVQNDLITIPAAALQLEGPFMQMYIRDVATIDHNTIQLSAGDYFIGLLLRDMYLPLVDHDHLRITNGSSPSSSSSTSSPFDSKISQIFSMKHKKHGSKRRHPAIKNDTEHDKAMHVAVASRAHRAVPAAPVAPRVMPSTQARVTFV